MSINMIEEKRFDLRKKASEMNLTHENKYSEYALEKKSLEQTKYNLKNPSSL